MAVFVPLRNISPNLPGVKSSPEIFTIALGQAVEFIQFLLNNPVIV
jgi:hypothetical protein